MKSLVVYYSRTGNTKIAAEIIAKELNADIEEIIDKKDRSGAKGYIVAGKDATMKKMTDIDKPKNDPKKYDVVIIGTPIWAWTMVPAVRTYMDMHSDSIKKVAFFCTEDGSGGPRAFKFMGEALDKEPIATWEILSKDIKAENLKEGLKDFVKELKK